MSGGHFNYSNASIAYEMGGEWNDAELDAIFRDLFGDGYNGYHDILGNYQDKECEFGPHGGGLAESLDYWLSGDTSEEDYRADVARFKAKWLVKRTPKNRKDFYVAQFDEAVAALAEKYRKELGGI